ncbi:CHAT domain-containing protein [Krasilnikovia sp. MM14-A1259]|uniref:CHAT domain-containing protein n=1 Tax=Krasilnikovia sp. MM14-A1259 TaxID=3373539 RepID=UPI0037F6A679
MQKLLTSVRRRSAAYLKRGDPGPVLSKRALTEAGQLLATARAASRHHPISPQVVRAVAWLHWCRYLSLPTGAGRDDYEVAQGLFATVFRLDPALVPEELRERLAAGQDEAGELGERGAQLLVRGDLANAIGLLRRAMEIDGTSHPERHMWLANLGQALQARFADTKLDGDLDEAVRRLEEALAAAPAGHPYRSAYLLNLGRTLRLRDRGDDLGAAITRLRAAIDECALQDDAVRARAWCLAALGEALHERFVRGQDPVDLDAAIAAWGDAADMEQDAADQARIMTNLSVALRARHQRDGNAGDAEASVTAARAAVEAGAGAERPACLTNLVAALALQVDEAADSEMIGAAREALAALPADHSDRGALLERLGGALWRRYLAGRETSDLDEAIACCRTAAEALPGEGRLANLTTVLIERAATLGDDADLTTVVADARWLLEVTGPDDPERAERLAHLGVVHRLRHQRLGETADLDAAIVSWRAVADAGTSDAGLHGNLSDALIDRFTRTGRLDDLIAAVAHARTAAGAVVAEHPDRPQMLAHFSIALRLRYRRLGDPADLDDAVDQAQAAVDATPAGHADRGPWLSTLNNALQARFERAGDPRDLDRAIAANLETLDIGTDEPHAARSNLGGSLMVRFRHGGDPADLDAAITHFQWAIDHTPAGHRHRASYLGNLGYARHARYDSGGDPADLEAAAVLCRDAVEASAGRPDQAQFLSNLAWVSQARFDQSGNETAADAALNDLRRAAAIETAPPAERVAYGRRRGDLAARLGRWSEAADGYAQAVAVLPLMAWRGLDRDGRQERLAWWGGTAADAAACATAAGRVEHAVALLEQGRAVSWAQLLDLGTDLGALRRVRPALADRLAAVGAELTNEPAAMVPLAPPPGPDTDRRIAAAHEWEELVARVRELDGFGGFLRPPPTGSLLAAAESGPVVIVNVSRWRCDALLVRRDGVQACPLPALTLEEAIARAEGYLTLLSEAEAADLRRIEAQRPVSGESPRTVARRRLDAARAVEEAHERVDRLLADLQAWLWGTIAEPVLDALGHGGTPEGDAATWPRVWWCPTGPLTVLPLHTAGRHGEGDRTVLDRVVSSYTPTLRALLEARRPAAAAGPEADRLLLVDVADPEGLPPIDNSAVRAALLRGFPAEARTVLDDVAAVRAALPHHRWAHFSCHGDQDLRAPSRGGLRLRDGVLTVADLSTGRFRGDFAGLSACKTAVGGIHLLDEVVTLAAALHHTGFRHVIAALWSIDKETSAEVFGTLYERIAAHGRMEPGRAPAVLHEVVRRIRDRRPDWPHRWTPFTHIGP